MVESLSKTQRAGGAQLVRQSLRREWRCKDSSEERSWRETSSAHPQHTCCITSALVFCFPLRSVNKPTKIWSESLTEVSEMLFGDYSGKRASLTDSPRCIPHPAFLIYSTFACMWRLADHMPTVTTFATSHPTKYCQSPHPWLSFSAARKWLGCTTVHSQDNWWASFGVTPAFHFQFLVLMF